MVKLLCRRHRFPSIVIQQALWLYFEDGNRCSRLAGRPSFGRRTVTRVPKLRSDSTESRHSNPPGDVIGPALVVFLLLGMFLRRVTHS
jgi:hypothetical protein